VEPPRPFMYLPNSAVSYPASLSAFTKVKASCPPAEQTCHAEFVVTFVVCGNIPERMAARFGPQSGMAV
jgi:hypothetical protein